MNNARHSPIVVKEITTCITTLHEKLGENKEADHVKENVCQSQVCKYVIYGEYVLDNCLWHWWPSENKRASYNCITRKKIGFKLSRRNKKVAHM